MKETMKKVKRVLSTALAAAFILAMLPAGALADSVTYKDGTYTASSTKGFGGTSQPVTVEVTISGGAITNVTSPSHAGESFWDTMNLNSLLAAIVQAGSADVNGITGATFSSNAVKDAAAKALAQAADTPVTPVGPTKRNVTDWKTLLAAAMEANEGDEIILDNDITDAGAEIDGVTTATLKLAAKNLTLNGNGKTISAAQDKTFCFNIEGDDAIVTVKDLTVDGGSFSAKLGGSMFIQRGADATLDNVTFKNCNAGSKSAFNGGGAIYINNHGRNTPKATIKNCTFEGNYVGESGTTGRGGAIYVSNGDLTVENTTFKGNKADFGGAIAADSQPTTVKVTNCTFDGNTSANADDIYIFDGASTGKKGMTINSNVNATLSGNTYTNPKEGEGFDEMNVIYGRFYTPEINEKHTAPADANDLNFGDIERTKVDNNTYVLMNIPYGKFYENEGVSGVDTVTSATKSKPLAGTLAIGSYHKNSDGSDISGVIFPVAVSDISALAAYKEVKDSDTLTITTRLRGQEVTTEYTGKDTLFENPDYAYYVLPYTAPVYKELTLTNGEPAFSAVNARPETVTGVTGSVLYTDHHADVIVKLENTTGIAAGDAVSGAIVTFEDGSKLALRHIVELWRAVEVGGSSADFGGKTLKNVRYITQDKIIDFPVDIKVLPKANETMTASFEDAKTIALADMPGDIQAPKATVTYRNAERQTITVASDVEVNEGKVILPEDAQSGTTYTVNVSSDNYATQAPTAAYTPAVQPAEGIENGSVAVDKPDAKEGETVTVTPQPASGYETGSVTVTDANGAEVPVTKNDNGTYTFTQPANGPVKVTPTFTAVQQPQPSGGGSGSGQSGPSIRPGSGSTTPTQPTQPSQPDETTRRFDDVAPDAWYNDAVEFAAERGIMQGTGTRTFEPNTTVTRAMMATIIYRLEGSPAPKGENIFTDVAEGVWYTDSIIWAAANGIVEGYGEGLFGPMDHVTREQMAAMLCRYARFKGMDVTADDAVFSAFSDKDDVSDWAVSSMVWATAKGVINGTDKGIEPKADSTRAQVAQVVKNYCEKLGQ